MIDTIFLCGSALSQQRKEQGSGNRSRRASRVLPPWQLRAMTGCGSCCRRSMRDRTGRSARHDRRVQLFSKARWHPSSANRSGGALKCRLGSRTHGHWTATASARVCAASYPLPDSCPSDRRPRHALPRSRFVQQVVGIRRNHRSRLRECASHIKVGVHPRSCFATH